MVHPHVRGEYTSTCFDFAFCYGSSPRAWGILKAKRWDGYIDWFIPTCVGNTRSCQFLAVYWVVHPHVRGEYHKGNCKFCKQRGSSPRAWGILLISYKFHNIVLVHPHVRGEYNHRVGIKPCESWFIPTCVGNTNVARLNIIKKMVHPHVRGEYLYISLLNSVIQGSSPRAWGILDFTAIVILF